MSKSLKSKKFKKAYLALSLSIVLIISVIYLLANGNNLPIIDIKKPGKKIHTELKEAKKTLNIAIGAMISPEITRLYYEDLMKIVAGKMGMSARIFQQRTYSEVNNLVKKRIVDLAYVCSGPFVSGNRDFGMELLVVPVINSRITYNSYIIVNKSSKIKSFEELKNRRFAFSDPESNTGFLFPKYKIKKLDIDRKKFFSETFFSYSHDNSIKAVSQNQCDGAAVDGLIWEFIQSINPELTKNTKIIEKSPPYGIPPFVVHPDLDGTMKKKLRKIFLSLHSDKKASKFLKKIHIQRFARGDISMYRSVAIMEEELKKK